MTKFCPNGGKVAYANKDRAKFARKTIGYHKNVKDFRIYKCPYCFMWHFTTQKWRPNPK